MITHQTSETDPTCKNGRYPRWCNVVPIKRPGSTCLATTSVGMSSDYEEDSAGYDQDENPRYCELYPLVYLKSSRDSECLRLISSYEGDINDDWIGMCRLVDLLSEFGSVCGTLCFMRLGTL